MKFSAHPLWLVGFRPFFALACLAGMVLPVLWALIFTGVVTAPPTRISSVQWHAHEMFFGFGWAVLGGFLLTATKNWVQVRGYHGGALIYLVAAWLFERAGMWFQGDWPTPLFLLSNNLFLVSIVAMVLATLIRFRGTDSYRDNGFFVVILPAFLAAKALMLTADHMQIGWSMAIGLYRMAFLVMLERTLTQFMKNAFGVAILRSAGLDLSIKGLGLVMVFESLLPPGWSGWIGLALALLLTLRFAFWKPQLAFRRLDIGIMYLGYLALVAQLLVFFGQTVLGQVWVGTVAVHVFSFGVMGLIIPAMLVRICQGHTGRKVIFDALDKVVLWVMILGFFVRIVAPQVAPATYTAWIHFAAACWFVCFAALAVRYVPFLFRPRVDGKLH